MPLELQPVTLEEANAFVEMHHRHHRRLPAHKFSIGINDGERIRGVAVIGIPKARMLNDGLTLEVNRVCTDGVKNGCSILYGAAWRAAKAMGYKKLVTYTLPEEGGASLRAAGWKVVAETAGGGKWARHGRPAFDTHPLQAKLKWEAPL